MKCAVHPDADAVGYCRNCGKAMCAVCVRPVRDVLYCEDCLANIMGLPVTPTAGAGAAPIHSNMPGVPPAPGLGPSPILAFFLGFLPGLGAFYNEQYGKGIIHLALFLFLFIIGVDGAISGGAEAARASTATATRRRGTGSARHRSRAPTRRRWGRRRR